MGRDADFGIARATYLAEWHDGHARVVAHLGDEDTGLWFRAPQTHRVKSFVPLSPATDAAPWVLRVEQRTRAQGLLEETEEVVEHAFFCHRPTTERPGRCPLDIVVRATIETRAKIDGTEPLADAMERRAGAASHAHPLRETRVGYRLEGNKLVTTLETGTLEDLPLGTSGSFTLE